jgi:radical SAM superfamily enzyme YgiQ (UPF0313 family)
MFTHVSLIALPKQDLIRPPGAMAILAAACEEYNVDYDVYDFNLWLHKTTDTVIWDQIDNNWNAVDPFAVDQEFYQIFLTKLDEYIATILNHNTDLLSISVFSDESACCAVELIERLNQLPQRKNFKILIGGTGIRAKLSKYHGKDLCTALLASGKIDYYIFGEGEITFRKILSGGIINPGINNFDAVQIDDLNQFPFPSYNKINPNNYKFVGQPEIIITGSRGCVRKCTYCDVAKYWPKYRYRSGKNIADELYYYYKTLGITSFEFSDSLINGSLKTFKEMNLTLIEYQTTNPDFKIKYKGQYICRAADAFKEQDYKDMKQAGCDYLYVGVESFSDKVRNDMLKKFNNDDLDMHLRMCGKYGIKNSFLMLIGYPTETLDDHQQNLDRLKLYQKYAQSGVISMIVFGWTAGILEDTPLFHMINDLNIKFDKNGYNPMEWISLDNPTLTLKERIRRWFELTNTASELGYVMPRMQIYISKFIDMLENSSQHKKISLVEGK